VTDTGVAPDVGAALGSLAALRAGLADGRWTPSDVIEAVLATRAHAPEAAWIDHVPAAELRVAAGRLTRQGARGRPLWGVPFAVKGNIDVAGLPTTAGCPGFATGPAAAHASVVARLVEAGALPVGTTNLDQFATGLVGTRSPYGACHAHGHPGWVSGGSSSGSAVVVAAGHVPFSLGTDTAGSGRVPAALNGIASMKPTRGLISAAGIVPACRSLDCVAVFAATPADAALVAGAATGLDPADPWARPVPPPADAPLGRAPRVGAPATLPAATDGATRAAEAASRRRMASLGWTLVEVDLEPFLAAGDLLYGGSFVAERYAAVGPAIRRRPAGLDPVVAGIIEAAEGIPAWQAFADLDRLQELAATTRPVWDEVDVLAIPTVPTTFTHAAVAADPLGTNRTLGTFTNFVNLLDLAAAVAPVGLRPDGHPYGVQLVGPAFSDALLADLAGALAVAPSSAGG
jgi:allophanate hydrolase